MDARRKTDFSSSRGEVREPSRARIARSPTRGQQYFAGDPRNANRRRRSIIWQGDSYNHDEPAFFNAGTDVRQRRRALRIRRATASVAARRPGFWRRANDDRTVRAIYPDGFLPFIKSEIADGSISGGLERRRAAAGSGISAPSTAAMLSTSRSTTAPTCRSGQRRRRRSTPASSRSANRRRRSISSARCRAPWNVADSRRARRRVPRRPVRDHCRRAGFLSQRRRESARRQRRADDATRGGRLAGVSRDSGRRMPARTVARTARRTSISRAI